MNNLRGLSCIRTLLPGLLMLAMSASASAQPGLMRARMGNPGMTGRSGSAAMAQPSRMNPNSNFGAMSSGASSRMAPAMQPPMSIAGGGTSSPAAGGYGRASYGM